MKKLVAVLLSVLLLAGCSEPVIGGSGGGISIFSGETESTQPVSGGEPGKAAGLAIDDLFSDRDKKTEYEANGTITLKGSTAETDAENVTISGSTVTITGEGVFEVSGTLDDGMIIVDAKKEKVQLVLKNANITSAECAPVYVKQADKVFLTLVGENRLENGGALRAIDSNDIDAAVYARDDLTINGTGSLTVVSPAGHGISGKDELTITGGNIAVESANHALDANDSIAICGGSFTLRSGKDGIHAENNDDAALGFVYIASGSFVIDAQGDGISAGAVMQLDGGSYDILCGGGAVNGEKQTSDGWGGMGGRPGGPGGPGGFGQQTTTEDSASIKGIKAGGELVVGGGSFTIDSADDAVHANADVTVCGGSFVIATGDDGFHADEALTILAGKIEISESYEGLEGNCVTISGGDIRLVASDDGINAAGGADGSGFGGHRGGDQFGGRGGPGGPGGMGGGSSDSFIKIAGGTVYVQASGDGIDANGTLEITGGETTVCGPTRGDTAVLDYDISATITGGSFIGTGSQMMAQTFSQSEQGVIALNVGNQAAGTAITVKDSKGNVLVDYAPALDFAITILSTPDMVKGETYTVTVGSQSGEFEAG